MAYKVIFTQKAIEDLDSIVEFHMPTDEKFAINICRSIISKAESLEEFADRGRMVPEFLEESIRHYRELILGNYRLIYRNKGKSVHILRIVDARKLFVLDVE